MSRAPAPALRRSLIKHSATKINKYNTQNFLRESLVSVSRHCWYLGTRKGPSPIHSTHNTWLHTSRVDYKPNDIPLVTFALSCILEFRRKPFQKYLFFHDSIAKTIALKGTDPHQQCFNCDKVCVPSPLKTKAAVSRKATLCLVYASLPSAQHSC